MPAATLPLPKSPTATEARAFCARELTYFRQEAAEAGRKLSRSATYRMLGMMLRTVVESPYLIRSNGFDANTESWLSEAAESAAAIGRRS